VKFIINFLVLFAVVIIIGTVAIFIVEAPIDSQINTPLDALWWTVATITTVGYGDKVPETVFGRIIAIFYMFFGVSLIAVSMSVAASKIYNKRFELDEKIILDQKIILEIIKKLEETEREIKQELKEIKDSLKQNKEESKKEI